MNHLTEDILLKYQFNLLDNTSRQEADEHLAACEQCRGSQAVLKQRFAVLDVIEEEADLSQALVANTLAQCTGRRKAFGLSWWKWGTAISAAAAMLLVGFFWLHQPQGTMPEAPKLTASYFDSGKEKQLEMKPQSLSGRKLEEMDQTAALASADTDALSKLAAPGQPRVVSASEIPDKPPFAPASSIELVILPRPEATQVTIYNSADLTLVRDTRKLVLKPGWNWLQFMWSNTKIDPTSLSLRPLEYADKVTIEQLSFPPRVRELGRWLIRSEVEGAVPFEITYFTSGLSWRAMYEGTLSTDESAMDLRGYVRVANNSGQDYVNAQTRLLLGQVRLLDDINMLAGRKNPYGPDVLEESLGYKMEDKKDLSDRSELRRSNSWAFGFDAGAMGGAFAGKPKGVEKEGLSEYFLYTIEGTEDLQEAWGKRLQSMDAKGIPVKSLYKYDEERYGVQTMRFVSFKNDDEHELGQTPLPEGSIRVFRDLSDAHDLSYVGASAFKYIPVNEDVELNMGGSLLVKIEPKLMDVKTANHTFDKDNNVNGWDEIETWQFKMTNTRDILAQIEITRNLGIDAWDLRMKEFSAGLEYKKHDKSHARFTLALPPQSEKILLYVVTKYQGQRSEYYTQKQKDQSK